MRSETILHPIEAAGSLDAATDVVSRGFSKVVKPGPLKDTLSGTWMGHPLHPMLTDVVIGAWTSAAILDLVRAPWAERASDVLVGAGLVAALPTAVSGASDLVDTPRADARRIGIVHAAANATAMTLYAAGLALRKRGRRASGTALTWLGASVAGIGGFLGGHLAYRTGVGVDETVFQRRPDDWKPAARADELTQNEPLAVDVEGTRVSLVRDGAAVHALADRCTHRGGPLHEGAIEDGCVRCPWHGSTFRLADGAIERGPATAPQPTYDVRVVNGTVEVRARS